MNDDMILLKLFDERIQQKITEAEESGSQPHWKYYLATYDLNGGASQTGRYALVTREMSSIGWNVAQSAYVLHTPLSLSELFDLFINQSSVLTTNNTLIIVQFEVNDIIANETRTSYRQDWSKGVFNLSNSDKNIDYP